MRIVLAEIEACQFRNRSAEETSEYMRPILAKHLPLSQNSSRSSSRELERKRDHYSHWTLRLAFSATEDLRKRFARLETQLFRLRLNQDDARERREFIESLDMHWETVSDEEKALFGDDLKAATGLWKGEEEGWFKVDWERVPEMVEQRKVLLKKGKAFVHVREQTSMVVGEFSRQLESGLEVRHSSSKSYTTSANNLPARIPRPSPYGRRQPPLTHSNTPQQILHSPRLKLYIRRLFHLRHDRHNRPQHRLSLPILPPLHAEPAARASEEQPPETLRATAIHAVPERPRHGHERMHQLLAHELQDGDRREVQERIHVQHPTRVRRRRRRRE